MKTETQQQKNAMKALEKFLVNGGQPGFEILTMPGKIKVGLKAGPEPHMNGGNYQIAYIVKGEDDDHEPDFRYIIAAKTLELAREFELKNPSIIDGRIHFQHDLPEMATVYLVDGTGPRGNVYKEWLQIDVKRGAYRHTPGSDSAYGAPLEEDAVSMPSAHGGNDLPGPGAPAKRVDSYNSVDDLRKALQRGDFERR